MLMVSIHEKIRNALGLLCGDESGQGMTEYIILVGLIAIACIGCVYLFGENIAALFKSADTGLKNPSDGAGKADVKDDDKHKAWDGN